jgi:hypothetical protein
VHDQVDPFDFAPFQPVYSWIGLHSVSCTRRCLFRFLMEDYADQLMLLPLCGPSVVSWAVFLFCVVITLVLKEPSFLMIGLFVILMKGSSGSDKAIAL